jgi:hypothetical protein
MTATVTPNHSALQSSIRAVTGKALDYNSDWHALFDHDGITAGLGFDGRLLKWINFKLSSNYVSLPAAMHAYAVSKGAPNWSALTTI